jgi:hypothetical protein
MPLLHRFRIDWNTVLRKTNYNLDRYVKALRIKECRERRFALDQIDRDAQDFALRLDAKSYMAAAFDPALRTNLVASTIRANWMTGIDSATSAEDRANMQHDLMRIAIGLAILHAEHGAYPEKLEELEPGVFDKLPPDLFGNKAFFYRRTADGYLLYSAGANNRDDGGSSIEGNLVEGQPLDSSNEAEFNAATAKMAQDADDLAVRVPRPPVQLPKPRKTTGSE